MTTTLDNPTTDLWKPGIHYNIDAADYHAIDAVSATRLKAMAKSPRHCKWLLDHPDEDKPAFQFGRYFHAMLLEPHTLDSLYVVSGMCSAVVKSTGECCPNPGKVMLGGQWLCGVHGKKADLPPLQVVTQDDHSLALAMARGIQDCPVARDLLIGTGHNEASVFWLDNDTGLRCKARIDRFCAYNGWSVHVDIKTTQDASERGFLGEVRGYNYPMQAAFYLDGCNVLAPRQRRFVFLAVEKNMMGNVGVWELPPDDIDHARTQYRGLMQRYKECVETGTWPSYTSDTIEVLSNTIE